MPAQEPRKLHVLLIYRIMIPSIRLCGHSQMESLGRQGLVEYRAIQEMRLTARDLRWADAVILGRLDTWYATKLTRMLHQAGKHLLYIMDDDLLNIPAGLTSAVHYGNPAIRASIEEILSLSHALLSPSPLLLEKYAVNGCAPVQMEEPTIDPIPYQPHDPAQPVKIGFAGSVDRTGDLEHALGTALRRLKDTYGDRMELAFFGAIPSFAKELNARSIPYCDSYDAYRRTLNDLGWDIGLAPMPDTAFHACKHYNKFVEYAAAGVAGIYSDVMPYTRLKAMNAPAVFCQNDPDEWYGAVSRWMEDRPALEDMRRQLADFLQAHLTVEKTAKPLWAYLQTIALAEKPDTQRYPMLSLKTMDVLHRGWIFLRKYGLKAPSVILKKIKSKL